jgi:hypothetical protein
MTLHLVKSPRKRKPSALLECPRCRGREVIETRIGVHVVDGKPTRGTKALICAQCHRNGERVMLA